MAGPNLFPGKPAPCDAGEHEVKVSRVTNSGVSQSGPELELQEAAGRFQNPDDQTRLKNNTDNGGSVTARE